MSIAGALSRGHADTIVLVRLMLRDSYSYEINKSVTQLSGGKLELKEATLYTAFRRLEEAGLVASYWGGEASGARRRYYAITPQGREACSRLLAEREETKEIMAKLLEVEKTL